MATLTVIDAALAGSAVVPASASGGGDDFVAVAGGEYLIHLRNGHSSSWSVSVDDPNSATPPSADAFDPDVTVAVANATEKIIRVKSSRFRNASTGKISLTYTGVTALTLNIYKA